MQEIVSLAVDSRIMGLELDAFFVCIIQVLEKQIVEPSASIQILR